MILLTGITGTTGSKVLDLLSRKNVPVRALVRDPGKVNDLDLPGLEIVQGDLCDAAAIEKALQGVDRAFFLMANVEEQLANEKRFIDVAARVGKVHLVKLSASGADAKSPSLLKSYHGQAEEHLQGSGLPYTIVRPNFYMQNMLHCAPSIIAEDKFYLPFREGRTGITAVTNVAEFIVEVLTAAGHAGKTYDVTGPEILSFYDLAGQMSEVLGRTITYVDLPPQEFRSQLLNWGSSEWYVASVMDLFELIAEDRGASISDTYAKVCGKAPQSFRQFVQEHAAVFGG